MNVNVMQKKDIRPWSDILFAYWREIVFSDMPWRLHLLLRKNYMWCSVKTEYSAGKSEKPTECN